VVVLDKFFSALTEKFAANVHSGITITSVRFQGDQVIVSDKNDICGIYHKVVFACNAQSALSCLQSPTKLERFILQNISYVEAQDSSFMEGKIHSDNNVFPSIFQRQITQNYCNYIHVTDSENPNYSKLGLWSKFWHGRKTWHYLFTFVISSWCPAVSSIKHKKSMLVSYNYDEKISPNSFKNADIITNRKAHPEFSIKNLFLSQVLHYIQGSRDGKVWYAGSYTTPGNGHDLSLLSGLVIGEKLGANYPFSDDPDTLQDYVYLRKLMFPGRIFSIFLILMMFLLVLIMQLMRSS